MIRDPAFLDTSYILALELSRDQNHSRAQAHWGRVLSAVPRLLTTSFVVDEAVTFLNHRGHHAHAVELGERLLGSGVVQVLHVDEALFREGLSFLKRHSDKRFSLTDCISFVAMHEQAIQSAFAFDQHFVQAGFLMEPQMDARDS